MPSGFGPHVEQQVAVLADIVDQVVHQLGGGLVGRLLEVAPTLPVVDGRVGDPLVVRQPVHAAQLQVHDAAAGGKIVVLVGDHDFLAALDGLVVVVGQELRFRVFRHAAKAEIEPEQVRVVVVDHFEDLGLPGLDELPAGARLLEELLVVDPSVQVVRLPVEPGVPRIGGVELPAPVGVEPPVFRVVQRHQESHALLADGLLEPADDVGLRAHPGRVPVVVPGVPHA